MYQARAKSFQTVKSLSYLYNKVCRSTNTPRRYCSDSSFKALSFVEVDSFVFQNPNDYQNPNGGNYSNRGDCGSHRQSQYNSSRSYSGNASSNKKLNEADKERKYLEELDSFCKDRKLKEAVKILGLLEQHNVSVDIPRYLFLINECGESQALQEAKHVHTHLTKSVPNLDVYIHNKILEMFLKCGSMEDAYAIFDKMPQRNLASWNMMITWLAENGHGEDAIEMFTEFKTVGLKPDNQMFHGVFTACSVVGDMREGLLHFESMINNYNLVPLMDSYLSVVAMLGSSGYLNEAVEFIEKMPIKPSVEIWDFMMNQSRVHGDLELGDHFAELVDLLDPSRLDEHSKVGLIPMKTRVLGFDHLDIKSKVYDNRDGDTFSSYHEKLYMQLSCLKQHMKEVGYVPKTRVVLRDVDQESKEEDILLHSVKLTLSHALLTSPARSLLRIHNDCRICVDCHNVLKIISKLVGRRIILLDEREHHIENGVCSCGDFL